MKIKNYQDLLAHLGACQPAKTEAGDKTIEEVMATTQRGDWFLWIAKRLDVDKRKLFIAKALCAKTVEHLMKDQRSKDAVQAALDYGNGIINERQLAAAAYAADAAYADAAAADAADAAAYADAYADAAKKDNQRQTADICREHLAPLIIARVNDIIKNGEI